MNILFYILQLGLSVLATKAASNPEGELLSMEDATINRSLYPESFFSPRAPKSSSPYFEKEGSLYYVEKGDTLCIALSFEQVSYGCSVSRNEFGIDRGFFPSPSALKCAYYEKDESKVRDFELYDIKTEHFQKIKYPYAGGESERLSLWVYESGSGAHIKIECTDFGEDRYLCGVSWAGEDRLLVQVLDRSQHHLRLNLYDALNGKFLKTLLEEDNDAWVEPYECAHFISDNIFVYSSANLDGYKNLYLMDLDGHIKRLTPTDADIFWAGCDRNYIYYTSAEISPVENHLFRIKVSGRTSFDKLRVSKPERLTKESGWHNILMGDGEYIDAFSSFDQSGWVKAFSMDGKFKRLIKDCPDPLSEYALPEMELGWTPSADGKFKNYYRLIKPLNFDPSKKYPLIVYVYGGPHSQMVNSSWLGNIRLWELYMAQRGYIVYVQDNRGTQRQGLAYEQAINRCCGKVEQEDQLAGIKALCQEPWVDQERIGVHGWSYGGFMTLSLKTTCPDLFKVAVAGGPVIDWKWYEVMYGERYMDSPQSNPEGYKKSSLMEKCSEIEGKVLICQGYIDPVVVWQHSMSFLQGCIDAGKQIDFFTFPCAEHNMFGKERVYLYDKISDYFIQNL